MGSAVVDLRNAILAGKESLTQLLRKAKVIAASLSLEDVEKWVDFELKGYPEDVSPPDYRTFRTAGLEVHNPYRGWEFTGNLEVPVAAYQPISEIERLSKGETLTTTLSRQVPLQDTLGRSAPSAWPQRALIPGTEFARIIDAVTNQLLQWAVELEKRGIKGENMDFDEKEKQLAANVHIEKFAGVFGNVTNSQVTVYDYGSINQLLIDHQIPKADRRELEDIMDEMKDATPEKKKSLLRRGEEWIVKHKKLLGAGAEAVGKVIGSAINH